MGLFLEYSSALCVKIFQANVTKILLSSTNEQINKINDPILSKFNALTKFTIQLILFLLELLNIKFFNSLTSSGTLPHNLILKEDSLIILLQYLCLSKLCNDTRLQIKTFKKTVN